MTQHLEDIRILLADSAEQGITVQEREHEVVLGGEVESPGRRDEICRRIADQFPELAIICDIGITRTQAPAGVEEIS